MHLLVRFENTPTHVICLEFIKAIRDVVCETLKKDRGLFGPLMPSITPNDITVVNGSDQPTSADRTVLVIVEVLRRKELKEQLDGTYRLETGPRHPSGFQAAIEDALKKFLEGKRSRVFMKDRDSKGVIVYVPD